MQRLDATAGRAWRFVFAPEDARRLAALRIGLCSLLALRFAIADYRAVADQPAALYQPLSYMKLLHAMPSHGVADAAQAIGIAAAQAANDTATNSTTDVPASTGDGTAAVADHVCPHDKAGASSSTASTTTTSTPTSAA